MTVTSLRERVLAPPRKATTGLLWLVGTGAAYAGCVLLLAAGGDLPGDLPPWLAIARDSYFWWEAAFIGPVIVAAGLLAAAVAYLLARAAGGTGDFDDTIAVLGPAVAGCTVVTLVPDLIIGTLLNTGLMSAAQWNLDITRPSVTLALVWTYLSLYLVAFLVIFPYVIRVAHRLRPARAVAIGWATFAVYQGVLMIFVR